MLKSRKNLITTMIYGLILSICINSNIAYANTTEKLSIFSAKEMLELAADKITEGRHSKSIVLLQDQSLNFEKDNKECCIVLKDENLLLEKNKIVIAKEIGIYEATVFYKDVGFVDYIIQVRSPEIMQNHNITMSKDFTYNLGLKNNDLAVYESSDESVVEVSNDGILKSKKYGKATISVNINDYQEIDFYIKVAPVFPNYTNEELNLIYAIVQQECATSYEGALAVISCAYNRSLSEKHTWKGADPLSQLTAKGQFCYSIDNYWKRYLNGNVYDYTKQAVYDCLYLGKTNHNYLSYRGFEIEGATEIEGNFYFDSL